MKTGLSEWKFTLIELLVVIAIIAVLAAMLLPALNKAREAGREAVCSSQIKGVAMVIVQYAMDNKEILPSLIEDGSKFRFWSQKMISYFYPGFSKSSDITAKASEKMHCPSQIVPPGSTSYGYNSWLGHYNTAGTRPYPVVALNKIVRPSQIISTGDADGDSYTTDDLNCVIGISWNIIGDFHRKGSPLGYVDGHVQFRTREQVSRWGVRPSDNSQRGPEIQSVNMMWGAWDRMYK